MVDAEGLSWQSRLCGKLPFADTRNSLLVTRKHDAIPHPGSRYEILHRVLPLRSEEEVATNVGELHASNQEHCLTSSHSSSLAVSSCFGWWLWATSAQRREHEIRDHEHERTSACPNSTAFVYQSIANECDTFPISSCSFSWKSWIRAQRANPCLL